MKLLRASIATIALAAVVVPAEAQDRIGITFAAGALGGIEVPVSTHLSLVASVRADLNAFEDRNRLVAALGGVRFSIN